MRGTMKIFKYITNGLPRLISYAIFYSPLIIIIGLFTSLLLTTFYSFVIFGSLLALLLDLSLLDMLISHHYMNKSTERTLATIEIGKFYPYEVIGIPYSLNIPCANYSDTNQQTHSLLINSRNINTKNLKQDQQIELVYSNSQPLIAQIAVDWDINQKKHMAENIAQLVLFGVFTITVNWGFILLVAFLNEVVPELR